MGIQVTRDESNLVTVQITGMLRGSEWKNAQKEIADGLKPNERISMLVIAEHFQGWGTGDWGDLSFQEKVDSQLDRLAIVTEKEWEERAMLFAGKGFRKVDMQFFPASELEQARQWVTTKRVSKY